MLVSFRCNRCQKPSVAGRCPCGGMIEAIPQRYQGPMILRTAPLPRPVTTVAQEIQEIRARHERRREYNRVANRAKRARTTHAIPCGNLDESDR